MIGQVTPGTCRHHAIENCELLTPLASAKPIHRFHQRPLRSGEIGFLLRVIPGSARESSARRACKYRPTGPLASGAHVIVAMSYFRQNGNTSALDPPIDDVELRLLNIEPRQPQLPRQ